MPQTDSAAEFDAFAGDYESALQEGIKLSGEDGAYFARSRVEWVRQRLAAFGAPTRSLLDFGCGTGTATPFLLELPDAEHLTGVDVSLASLETARSEHGSERVDFRHVEEGPRNSIDLAYVNGVFHHIPLEQRAAAVASVRDALRPGGFFAFWENNPWNPATRLVMRRIPFDRDAVMLSAPESRRLLAASGLEVVTTDFLFIFPNALRALRPVERHLARLPLGAQYLVLARRPR